MRFNHPFRLDFCSNYLHVSFLLSVSKGLFHYYYPTLRGTLLYLLDDLAIFAVITTVDEDLVRSD